MSLPSSVGLPQEMMLGHLDFSIPPDAKSYSVKIQPSNTSSVTTTLTGLTAGVAGALNVVQPDQPFPSQNIIFDLPCGSSPSAFLDSRFTTLNFRATYTITTVGAAATTYGDSFLRSGANSFFDRMYITSQNGQIIEDIGEYGMVNDTLCSLQMNHAVRRGTATQFGFNSNNVVANNAIDNGSQGHKIGVLSVANNAVAAGQSQSNSYSVPLLSGVVGVLADKFINVGRTSKLQIVLATTNICPITLNTIYAAAANAPTITVTLDNFSLSCEYIDIGINALQMLDATLIDGKEYIHGTTYRTTSVSVPTFSGATSVLAGIRASSVKSLFTRFVENGPASAVIANGKYDSKNPCLNGINYSVGGIKFPQQSIDPLHFPSQAFRETQMAIGSFNNAQFQSSISPANYCKLSQNVPYPVAELFANGQQCEQSWTEGSSALNQAQFIFGECMEVVARRGLLSGLNATSAPIFLELSAAAATTYGHTAYVTGMLDMILVHDIKSGDITCRI